MLHKCSGSRSCGSQNHATSPAKVYENLPNNALHQIRSPRCSYAQPSSAPLRTIACIQSDQRVIDIDPFQKTISRVEGFTYPGSSFCSCDARQLSRTRMWSFLCQTRYNRSRQEGKDLVKDRLWYLHPHSQTTHTSVTRTVASPLGDNTGRQKEG